MAEGTITPDLCVLGGGTYAAAAATLGATIGLRVVFVRSDAENRHAPVYRQIHALAAAASAARGTRPAGRFGVEVPETRFDYARMRKGAQETLADLALNETDVRLAALGVRVIGGGGRFMDPAKVTTAGHEIRARRFLLVPPFASARPAIRGLSKTAHLTAERILDPRECPRHLVVIGAGATGLSLAQSFRRFGAEVTVLEKTEPLAGEDRDGVDILLEALEREGIRLHGGADVERVEGKKGELRVTFQADGRTQTVEGTHLLLAAGWKMDAEALGLELAGIETDAAGIRIGPDLRTTNRRVFLAGNGPHLPQADAWHARLILANLMSHLPLRPQTVPVARATATDPALAHVGLGEDEARAHHGRIRILRWPFAENEAAVLAEQGKGFVKLIATERGRLVGATIAGAGAGDLIAPYALAISQRLHLSALAGPMFPHSARGAAGQQAALMGLRGGLTVPWVRRIIAALRWFG
jgi:pyruvate/2-oxoglutarate dehydrogenase complex dihydrolipoamide dehydrogenase (E3) component